MLSIITINYNGSADTIKLLKSLKQQTDKDFGIITVDNKSAPEDTQTLQNFIETHKNNFVTLKLIKSADNLGFSGGNNLGIKQALSAGVEWVVLLNNDTWMENDFIARLKLKLSTTDAGIAGIPLKEGEQTAYCGKIAWFKPTLKHIYESKNNATDKFYAIGGGMAINKKVFEKIGLLNENYFLYFEDADFSIKAAKAGFKIKILSNLKVHHAVSSSANRLGSPTLLKYHYRNALYFNFKNGPWYIKVAVWPWSWIITIKQLLKIATGKNRKQSFAILAGVLSFYINKMGEL